MKYLKLHLILIALLFVFQSPYKAQGYHTVKLLTVTDYGAGNATSGTYYYITHNGQAFISALVTGSRTKIEVRIWGNEIDDTSYRWFEPSSGQQQWQLMVLSPGHHITVTVFVDSNNEQDYCTADLWQWQQY